MSPGMQRKQPPRPTPQGPTDHFRQRVRQVRERRGYSQVELAAEVNKLGVAMDRAVLANLEFGRRQSVTLEQAMGLAAALGVNPVDLLLPQDDEAEVAVAPKERHPAAFVRGWMTGEHPLAVEADDMDQAEENYFREVPPAAARARRHERHPLIETLELLRIVALPWLDNVPSPAAAAEQARVIRRWGQRAATHAHLLADRLDELAEREEH